MFRRSILLTVKSWQTRRLCAWEGGAVTVFVTNKTDVILDTTGYFAPWRLLAYLGFFTVCVARLPNHSK